ncbi:hypothetical protein ANCDUO_20177, partial [Ancylostoma duodenale]
MNAKGHSGQNNNEKLQRDGGCRRQSIQIRRQMKASVNKSFNSAVRHLLAKTSKVALEDVYGDVR